MKTKPNTSALVATLLMGATAHAHIETPKQNLAGTEISDLKGGQLPAPNSPARTGLEISQPQTATVLQEMIKRAVTKTDLRSSPDTEIDMEP